MTNLRSLSDLLRAARKLAAVCAFTAAIVTAAAGQTNTFPTSGNAGIGTTTFDASTSGLQVQPAARGKFGVMVTDTDGSRSAGLSIDSDGFGHLYLYDSGGTLRIHVAASSQDHTYFNHGGNVGIGTITPSFPLEVSKSQAATTFIQVTNSNTSAGNAAAMRMFTSGNNALTLSATGNAGAGGYAAITQEANLPLLFQTSLTERMRITGGGNVGIGTASPDTWAKLHVFNAAGAGIDVQSAGAASWSRLRLVTATRTYGWFAGDSTQGDAPNKIGLYDYTAGAFRMMFDSSGNVGVGTSSPVYKFDVQNGQINASGGLCIAGDCKTAWTQLGGSQWTGTSSIYYNGGNVGIGTTSPSAKLELAPNSALKLGNAFFSSGGDYVHLSNNEWYNGTSWTATAPGALIQISGQDVNFYRHDAAGAHTQSMKITSSGSVGIGTASPLYSLDVNGGVNGFRAKAATASSSDAIATFENSGGIQAIVRGNGYIGMGTTSPAEKLEINGNLKLSGTGNINATGTIEAGNIKAKYQDVAEWVPSPEQLAAGTVVVLDTTKSNQVISSSQSYDTRVAGVISAQPGITLGESGEGKVLVATTGRVRVKVDASRGAIQIGDLLVTSDLAGVAMKSEAVELAGRKMHMPGTIIGKALEPLAKGSGEILVLLSLQ